MTSRNHFIHGLLRASLVAALAALVLGGCVRRSQSQSGSAYGPPGQPPVGAYGQAGYPPGSYPPGTYPPGQPAPTYTQPTPAAGSPTASPPTGQLGTPPAPQPPLPPVANDPLNNNDLGFERARAQSMLQELVQALPDNERSLVQNIPLVVDDTPGEVNAFAACSQGKAAMAITDGLLEIQGQMAQCRANDEIFGTNKLDAYIALIVKYQKPKQPIVRPAPGFYDPAQQVDGRKVKRQHEIFDEELAFVLGHELAHHYRGHTGCVGSSPLPISPQDINRVLSNAVPVFNQPNEIEADTQGTYNLLNAGTRRSDYHYTENGALLTLYFFEKLDTLSPAESVLFAFEMSHPPPAIRRPIVQQAAAQWRAGGGQQQPTQPSLPFPFPIPGIPGLGG